MKCRFPLGDVQITMRAVASVDMHDMLEALKRHAVGDWGNIPAEIQEQNERAVESGGRLGSSYHDRTSTLFWIVTEGDRLVTKILVPEDME
jgi:hypothetical protein